MYTPPKKKGPRARRPVFTGKLKLRVGDTVRVIAGKDKGKEGRILRVLPADGKVVVEGVNIVVKHQKPRPQMNASPAAQPQGGRIEQSAPLYAAKVQLVDPGNTSAVTRVGIRTDANGSRVRYAKKSGGLVGNG